MARTRTSVIRDDDGMGGQQLRDTDVFVEGLDETGEEANKRTARPRGRTLSGSQTTFTKGDKSKYTVANNRISGESAVTVLFGIPANNLAEIHNHSPTPMAYAEVRFLVDGVAVKRLISITSGEQITGVGEYVSVQIWDATTPDDQDPNPTYPITCLVAPGTRGSSDTLPTYFPNPVDLNGGVIPPSEGLNIPIPQNVGMKTVRVLCDDPTGVTIVFVDYLGNDLFSALLSVLGQAYMDIPIGALNVQLVNGSMTDARNFSISFGVSG